MVLVGTPIVPTWGIFRFNFDAPNTRSYRTSAVLRFLMLNHETTWNVFLSQKNNWLRFRYKVSSAGSIRSFFGFVVPSNGVHLPLLHLYTFLSRRGRRPNHLFYFQDSVGRHVLSTLKGPACLNAVNVSSCVKRWGSLQLQWPPLHLYFLSSKIGLLLRDLLPAGLCAELLSFWWGVGEA